MQTNKLIVHDHHLLIKQIPYVQIFYNYMQTCLNMQIYILDL
jgi:hypothetical protein